MRDLLLYADAGQLNDATNWYLETISKAAERLGYQMRHVSKVADVGDFDRVLVVECKSAFMLSLRRPRAQVWLWMQGVFPEEARLHFGSPTREILWRFFERVAVPRMRGVIMVSQAMQRHFRHLYPGWTTPTVVMPCANADLCEPAFHTPGKYDRPWFVYAGSLHEWQCVAHTIQVFKRIQAAEPNARLSVFTKDIGKARELLATHGLENVEVASLTLSELGTRLAEFKYGFVLRENHVVNRVATPTKVASYMAAGVIPIMTTAVDDYNLALASTEPIVMSDRLDVELIVRDVLAQESRPVSARQVLCSYQRVFADYFDHARYVPSLRSFFSRTGLSQ